MATVQTQLPSAVPVKGLSYRAQYASMMIKDNLGSIEKKAPAVPTKDATQLLPAKNSTFIGPARTEPLKVGIIGAGAAGLFTAMIFDHLKDKFGLEVEYEIFEADNRVGGRLYSYHFEETDPDYPVGPHDYYDVGAMRFPEIDIMKRTFELFEKLGMNKIGDENLPKPEQGTSKAVPIGSLVPYYFSGPGQPSYFNGVQVIIRDKEQIVTANDFNITGLPTKIANTNISELVDRVVAPYTEIYNPAGPKAWWDFVIATADQYTVREYMTVSQKYDYNTIEFLETMNYGNRWYDQAFTEMILENMDFDPKADWWCVEGGTTEIAKRMHRQLKRRDAVHFGKTVKAISYADEERKRVNITLAGESDHKQYDAVFNSAPLGAMQHMQLEGLKLNWGTKQAIRSLGYGASCKVGIRFKKLWWIEEGIRQGGQGHSDLSIGTCVYPSYNIHDDPEKPGVLLVSYTWAQQAERLGALIDRHSPAGEEQLKELLIHDLARMHAKSDDEADYLRLHALISDLYLTHYAYNWYSNPRTAGAFAYFGPEQFKNMYKHITRSDGKHIIIGEAASAHHAWVVGSLESAVRGVYQFLYRHSKRDQAACDAARAYERDDGSIEAPFGPLPAEFDYRHPIVPDAAHLANEDMPSAIGGLARLQVLFETIRLKDPEPKDLLDPEAITRDVVEKRLVLGDLAESST